MKVKDLIYRLKFYDPELDVNVAEVTKVDGYETYLMTGLEEIRSVYVFTDMKTKQETVIIGVRNEEQFDEFID